MEDEGFYVTLPSNAGLSVFKDNTISSFRVNLAQHINLEGSWQVALTEISYPHTWHNVPEDSAYFEWRDKKVKKSFRQNITPGYYKNVLHLIGEIEPILREIKADVSFEPIYTIVNKISFKAGGQYQLRFHSPIAYMLGVQPGRWLTFDKFVSHPIDMQAGFYMIYCYSDVVEHQMVGDSYAPLLRILRVEGKFGDIITQTFNPPDYLPVARKHLESIKIELKSDQNVPINFTYGKAIAKLHFRPVRSRGSLR